MDLLSGVATVWSPLLADLKRRSIGFHEQSKLQKLLGAPWRFAESEYAVRTGTVLRRTVSTFWGGRMDVTLPEPVSMYLYRYGYFEEGLSSLFLAVLKPGGGFLDVGSHYGYYSLLARHLVGPSGRVVALEPTPSTFAVNRGNTGAFENIHVENVAAWSSPTTFSLTDFGVAWSSHNSLLGARSVPEKVRRASRKVDVPCIVLDEYLAAAGFKPDLIKIDAESAELEILKGLEKTLRSVRPIVTLEVGDEQSSSGVRSIDAVKYCVDFDYVPFVFGDWAITPHEIRDDYDKYDNVFLVPTERLRSIG